MKRKHDFGLSREVQKILMVGCRADNFYSATVYEKVGAASSLLSALQGICPCNRLWQAQKYREVYLVVG